MKTFTILTALTLLTALAVFAHLHYLLLTLLLTVKVKNSPQKNMLSGDCWPTVSGQSATCWQSVDKLLVGGKLK